VLSDAHRGDRDAIYDRWEGLCDIRDPHTNTFADSRQRQTPAT
jgi:hypothetical protein